MPVANLAPPPTSPVHVLLPNLQFCPSLQWRMRTQLFVWIALSKTNFSSTKDVHNCFNTNSLAALATAPSWASCGQTLPVLASNSFFFAEKLGGVDALSQRQNQQKKITTSGPTQTRLTGVRTPGAHGPDVAQHVRGGTGWDAGWARPNTEADEAGQVRVNLHESLDQQGSQASEHVHPC